VLQGAGEKDNQSLDDDDHVAGNLRFLKGQFRPALVKHAEENCRQNHADRMLTPHQGDGDADETGAAGEFKLHALLVAHDRIERHHAGESTGNQHCDDGYPGR